MLPRLGGIGGTPPMAFLETSASKRIAGEGINKLRKVELTKRTTVLVEAYSRLNA